MSTGTMEEVDLDLSLGDDEECFITYIVTKLFRIKLWTEGECHRPATDLVLVTCPNCGSTRKPVCKKHLKLFIRVAARNEGQCPRCNATSTVRIV